MKPFLITIPSDILNRIEKNIPEEEIKASQKLLEKYEIEFVSSNVKEKVKLSPEELAFTFDIYNRPFKNFTDRISGMLTNYKGSKLKEDLSGKGMIKGMNIRLKRKGNPDLFLELTDAWHNLAGVKRQDKGKGGFMHRLFQDIIAVYFKARGRKVKKEAFVGESKLIDILVDDKFPFEIETGESGQEIYNVQFNLKYFPKVFVVTPIENHTTVKERILRGIKTDSEKVKFCSIDAFTSSSFQF